jgi:hypothetical protein
MPSPPRLGEMQPTWAACRISYPTAHRRYPHGAPRLGPQRAGNRRRRGRRSGRDLERMRRTSAEKLRRTIRITPADWMLRLAHRAVKALGPCPRPTSLRWCRERRGRRCREKTAGEQRSGIKGSTWLSSGPGRRSPRERPPSPLSKWAPGSARSRSPSSSSRIDTCWASTICARRSSFQRRRRPLQSPAQRRQQAQRQGGHPGQGAPQVSVVREEGVAGRDQADALDRPKDELDALANKDCRY